MNKKKLYMYIPPRIPDHILGILLSMQQGQEKGISLTKNCFQKPINFKYSCN